MGKKNIQVIDGALNCTYSVYQITEEDFKVLFPKDGQNIEFAEEFFKRQQEKAYPVWERLWETRINKEDVIGIHGTLFCGLTEKKKYYPTKIEDEMIVVLE